ncbi:MAG: protein of unknown function (DUF3387) [Candidatus Nitrotoga sp. SPKER]|nr:MAG: protein of unknown function (DUF3387) [Candidatus Nitrotoga sp. SPKER]
MQGHGLMQAIARVNRVFRDKPAGLIVDYIGIAQNLKSALQQYSKNDQENTSVDEAQAITVMNDGIRSRSKANVVQTKAFSERLKDAVARYHANAITTAVVLQELIQLAEDIRAARQRGEESVLS